MTKRNVVDVSEWPTKPEAAQMLSRSGKTINRWVAEGKLRVEYRSVPRRKPIPVYDPRFILKMKEEMEGGSKTLERAEGAAEVNERDKRLGSPLAIGQAIGAAVADRMGGGGGPDLAQALQAVAAGQQQIAEVFARALEHIASGMHQQQQKALPPPAERLTLTLGESIERSGLDAKGLRRLIKSGTIRNFGNSRDPRIPRADLEAALGPKAAQ